MKTKHIGMQTTSAIICEGMGCSPGIRCYLCNLEIFKIVSILNNWKRSGTTATHPQRETRLHKITAQGQWIVRGIEFRDHHISADTLAEYL